jgi:hypothetical protein
MDNKNEILPFLGFGIMIKCGFKKRKSVPKIDYSYAINLPVNN